MCHGHIDPKILMRDAEARYRAAQPAVSETGSMAGPATLPPELMGGLRGVWARLCASVARLVRMVQWSSRTAR